MTNPLGQSQVFEYETFGGGGEFSRLKKQITPDGPIVPNGSDFVYDGIVTEFEYTNGNHPTLPTKQITAKEKVQVKVDVNNHNLPSFQRQRTGACRRRHATDRADRARHRF